MDFTCKNCGKVSPLKKNTTNTYCSNKCQGEFLTKVKIASWLSGEEQGWTGKTAQLKGFVRKYLFEERGTACSKCGWDKRHDDGSILTEIDHVDGDAKNCSPDNLQILCPNCHSLTPTFRVRNKNSTRIR